jgi:hypothetical protein
MATAADTTNFERGIVKTPDFLEVGSRVTLFSPAAADTWATIGKMQG